MDGHILKVENLTVTFPIDAVRVPVVDSISFALTPGETLALVGESGSGKSITALAVMRLVPKPGRIEADSTINFDGRDIMQLPVLEMRDVRGDDIAMIFQEPMTSLNPVVSVGKQVSEAILLHENISVQAARQRVVEFFEMVGIPEPHQRYAAFPHQLSGGLKQRVMIAMAMVMRPRILIADEPTTALDVTVQAQILELLRNLGDETGAAILLITHDFGIVNEVADRVAVMYAGQIVEVGERKELLLEPRHPYTQGLLRSVPRPDARGDRLEEIAGVVPSAGDWPRGCRFEARCHKAFGPCRDQPPPRVDVSDTQVAWCHAVAQGIEQ